MNLMQNIKRLLRKLLELTKLRQPPFFISDNPDFSHIKSGKFSYGKPLIMGWDGTSETKVTIGRFCSIADGVRILLRVNHPIDAPSTYPFSRVMGIDTREPYEWSRGPVVIGHDVWIGQDAVIMGGVNIGNGAVIAAKSVLTKDVPPYGIVAGNPARLIKKRFDDETIKALSDICWWDWPESLIRQHAQLLSHGKIGDFLQIAAKVSDL
jgi:acetyltransferase-like isoleucine patch superfamily enzyme